MVIRINFDGRRILGAIYVVVYKINLFPFSLFQLT